MNRLNKGMRTQIVETVNAADMAQLRRRRDAAINADIVELRLDGVRDVDVAGALRDRSRPVVVTCRPTWEGGAFDGPEEQRRRILTEAVALDAEYVDIERKAEWRPNLRGSKTAMILSEHDFAGVPADAAALVTAMRRETPRIVKLSAMAQSASDCLRLRDAVRGEGLAIAIGMGPFGRVTRALPSRFGSCWTYAGTAAPGQYSVREVADVFRVREVTASTEVFGVTGRPLEHSASPVMHSAAFRAMGLDAVYVPIQAASVDDAMAVASALGVCGLSVTAPLKRGWTVTLDDDASRELGTINTVKRDGAVWRGRNVDGDGFLDALDARGIDVKLKRVLVLGAGGAARAVGRALIGRGASVSVCARRPEQAAILAEALSAGVIAWPATGDWDMVVNATPAGTWPDVASNPLTETRVQTPLVYDLVYNPEETALMCAARADGAATIGGLEMLVSQAARQSEWWTGRTPPVDVMTEAARQWIAATTTQGEQ